MKLNKLPLALLTILFVLGLSACQQDGPAEEAGEAIDNAVEDAGDKIEDATD